MKLLPNLKPRHQREVNAKRHALLDAEAKIETGNQETKELTKELAGCRTKLKEAEESLSNKGEEVALLQVCEPLG